jgi:uncharacterized membrane protein
MSFTEKPHARPDLRGAWLVPGGLIVLGLIPVAGGVMRLVQMGGGALTPDSARFLAAPLPVVLHILCSVVYALLGALQFSDGLRRRHPKGHRVAGKLLVACGLVVALSGVWMTLIYPVAKVAAGLPSFDGPAVYAMRLVVGVAMAGFLVLGYTAIRQGDVRGHRAWMMRAYALGIGAGTQALTHIPWFLFPGIHGELARTVCMAAGWAINMGVVEWVLAREVRRVTA